MNVEAEGLRIEVVVLQPAPPPQDDSSPRRSPVVGTGLDEAGGSRAEMQSTEKEEVFPLQVSFDGFLHVCTSLEQEWTTILLQADVGVDDEETTTTNAQGVGWEEFLRPLKKRQQQRMTVWGINQTKQFDPGG